MQIGIIANLLTPTLSAYFPLPPKFQFGAHAQIDPRGANLTSSFLVQILEKLRNFTFQALLNDVTGV